MTDFTQRHHSTLKQNWQDFKRYLKTTSNVHSVVTRVEKFLSDDLWRTKTLTLTQKAEKVSI
jgi:hypothetical protein